MPESIHIKKLRGIPPLVGAPRKPTEGIAMSTTKLNRRAILAGAATVPAVAILPAAGVAATTGHDPIFAAIEDHRRAHLEWRAAVHHEFAIEGEFEFDKRRTRVKTVLDGDEVFETDDPRWLAAVNGTADGYNWMDDCAFALVKINPTTLAGVIALLNYCNECGPGAEDCDFPEDIEDASDDDTEKPFAFFLTRHVARALAKVRS
jgi:hypothetical protein